MESLPEKRQSLWILDKAQYISYIIMAEKGESK